jgi:hypothetical protein
MVFSNKKKKEELLLLFLFANFFPKQKKVRGVAWQGHKCMSVGECYRVTDTAIH